MTRKQIEHAVIEIVDDLVRDIRPNMVGSITQMDLLVDDLGFDETDFVGFICAAEDHFGIELPDDWNLNNNMIVRDLVDQCCGTAWVDITERMG